jgi:hypothetical protein
MATQASASAKEVILEGPDQYHSWFANIIGSTPEDLWEYFYPESVSEFRKPQPVTFSTVKEGTQSLQQLSSGEKNLFVQLSGLYNTQLTHYHRYLSEQAKLRKLIHSTVSDAKRAQLKANKPVKDWLKNLQTSTEPSDAQMEDIVKARHRKMMNTKF